MVRNPREIAATSTIAMAHLLASKSFGHVVAAMSVIRASIQYSVKKSENFEDKVIKYGCLKNKMKYLFCDQVCESLCI